ncbi:signal peptidase I [Sporosarcina sp. CAU 1771]
MSEKSLKEIYSWIKALVIAFILAILIRQFLFTPVIVSGESMEPTFENDNRIVIAKVHTLNHFDMIVFHAPGSEDDFIKRVIGLARDVIVMKNDELMINGKVYQEDYVHSNKEKIFIGQKLTQDFEVTVPKGHVFVLGDNRRRSRDSRDIGFINEESIVGKVAFRFYPMREIGIPR